MIELTKFTTIIDIYKVPNSIYLLPIGQSGIGHRRCPGKFYAHLGETVEPTCKESDWASLQNCTRPVYQQKKTLESG